MLSWCFASLLWGHINGNLSTNGDVQRPVTVRKEGVSQAPPRRCVSFGKYITHIDTMRSLCALCKLRQAYKKRQARGQRTEQKWCARLFLLKQHINQELNVHCSHALCEAVYFSVCKQWLYNNEYNITRIVIHFLRLPKLLANKTLLHTYKTDKDADGVAFFVKRSECENPIWLYLLNERRFSLWACFKGQNFFCGTFCFHRLIYYML